MASVFLGKDLGDEELRLLAGALDGWDDSCDEDVVSVTTGVGGGGGGLVLVVS